MAAFKDSQKRGAGPYTGNAMVGRTARTGDPATDPKSASKPGVRSDSKRSSTTESGEPQSIAKHLDVSEGYRPAPIVSSAGGYRPVTGGGGRRYEPL